MTPVLILLVIFGSITLWRFMAQAHEQKMAELQARQGTPPAALPAANQEYEERLRHLESIVCSVDFELNAKLNQLASKQLALAQSRPGETVDTGAHTEAVTLGQLEAGTTLAGRFEVERTLGAGGMGSVYLAHDRQLGERVAVKVIGGMAAIDAAAQERLRREASAARRISHPNVVRLHDIGDERGLLFLSMEYVPGGSLRDLISRHGALPPGQLRPLVAQVLEGLQAAHAQGVVHRDLKPANVLIDERGQAKIIDFGLARLPHLEGMTATGTLLGTPEYMAPEQIKGGAVDARSDLYAVGAVTFHALTGRAPFRGANPIAVSLAQLTETPPPLRSLRADVPEAWEAFVAKAMAKDPAHRFATAGEMKAALPT